MVEPGCEVNELSVATMETHDLVLRAKQHAGRKFFRKGKVGCEQQRGDELRIEFHKVVDDAVEIEVLVVHPDVLAASKRFDVVRQVLLRGHVELLLPFHKDRDDTQTESEGLAYLASYPVVDVVDGRPGGVVLSDQPVRADDRQ